MDTTSNCLKLYEKRSLLFLKYEIVDSTVKSIFDMLILFCYVVDNHSFGVLESSPTCQAKLHVCHLTCNLYRSLTLLHKL